MQVDSFILYTEQKEIINTLNDNDAGVLFKNIYKYVSGENVELEGILNVVFITIRQHLDRNAEKYQAFCQKQRENGKKGGRPKKNKNPKNPSLFPETQKSLNDNVNDNVNDNDNKKGGKFIKPTIEEIKNYCEEKNITSIDAEYFFDHYESVGWMIGKTKMKDWKAKVRTWARDNKNKGVTKNEPEPYNACK